MELERRECGTCGWWERPSSPRETYGSCRDAMRRAKEAIPESVWLGEKAHVNMMAAFAGVECPCWTKRGG